MSAILGGHSFFFLCAYLLVEIKERKGNSCEGGSLFCGLVIIFL